MLRGIHAEYQRGVVRSVPRTLGKGERGRIVLMMEEALL
jgi:hypothetical protein